MKVSQHVRSSWVLALCVVLVALGARITAASATKTPGPTSGPVVQYGGINEACPGFMTPTEGSSLFIPTETATYAAYGVVPDSVRDWYTANPFQFYNPYGFPIPQSVTLYWTTFDAVGMDGAGVMFTVKASVARLYETQLSDNFVGVGSMKITRADGAKLMSDGAYSYSGSRSGFPLTASGHTHCVYPRNNK